jgi:DNA repair protein RecN (Recombination protein N)
MLQELSINNFVVANQLRLRFGPGLNLLTGETGSGKSIIVDALSLLFGARAHAEVIRPGEPSAQVVGVFSISKSSILQTLLNEAGLHLDQGELILGREVLDSGKSRAYVNERPVTVTLLRKLAPFLGDIHGQHEQQHLFATQAQLEMLDMFAGTTVISKDVATIYSSWYDTRKRLDGLRGNEQERLRQLDLYEFQVREIEQAAPQSDEISQLEMESRLLENLERIQQSAASAYDRLYDSTVSAGAQIKAAQRSVDELGQFDDTLRSMTETLSSAQADIGDVSFGLRSFLDRLEPDPHRLEEIEDRIALLKKLQRKYGGSIEEVITYGEKAQIRLGELRAGDAATATLENEQQELARRYQLAAEELSKRRHQAADHLEKQVEVALSDLAMERARFKVNFEPIEGGTTGWSVHGIDHVHFLVSANPGQPPRPLAQVASGGELSRITLALKTCLIAKDRAENGLIPRTLVFDEIDSGVGGRVAEAVGRRLERLADDHQLLCVTHLAQIAGFADTHFVVTKREQDDIAVTSVEQLSERRRIEELARMLSGETITVEALQHAKQMVKRNSSEAS